MTIGAALSKSQLDSDMAAVALGIAKLLRQIDQLHEFFLITPDATLEGLTPVAYTAAEVATLKSAWNNDAPLLASIIRGQVNLPSAQDFRANLFQMIADGLV